MQPISGHQRPDLLTSLMNMSFVLCLPREMHLSRSSSNVPRLPSFLEMLQNHHVLLTFGKVQNPSRLPRKTASEHRPSVFNIFDFEINVLRATTACTVSTSDLPKRAPKLRCFVHFDFEMCFAPQRRTLFEHLNFQNCFERGVFCAFLTILTSKCASRHKGCAFSTSQLPKLSKVL